MLRGSLVYLTALDPANAEQARAWVNDPEINRWMLTGHIPVTAAAELAFYEQMEASERDHAFEIHALDDGRYLGNCGLHGCDPIDRHGELGIFVGDAEQHGRGYGRDALVIATRFGFETLGLHTVRIRCVADNERALGLYRSIGFRDAGVMREARYQHGCFHDMVWLDMTRAEWDELASR